MKFSELARGYERIRGAAREPERARLLAALFRAMDARTLEAAAHFTASELVKPELSERLGVGPGLIRSVVARLSGRAPEEGDDEVKRTGDMSEVVAANVGGRAGGK